jgi:YidC/Oxa1 family membrane protein insertase
VKPGTAAVEYYSLSIPAKTGDPSLSRDYIGYDIRFQSMPGGPANARFFVGPKHFETMRRVDVDLVRAIWFGMFAFLCVPLLSALNWLDGFLGNYGWSIIALTVIINAAMFPLRHKSNVSMRKMQAIQPQIKAIQDRYAKLKTTDPARQKMNTEMMELYREKGVNPASGCVPMLLTFPVLFAFYSLLSEAIELRGQPFILWSRPRGRRPLLRVPDSDGSVPGIAAEDDADDVRRSRPAEDDALHAHHLHVPLPDISGRPRAVLVREQRARDWAAGADEQADQRLTKEPEDR